tara:strand:+ start:171 stop:479 length:309 start_codon:yes stop_codon:yes gene_type:complete
MSGDKIPDLDSSGKFVTPLSGNEEDSYYQYKRKDGGITNCYGSLKRKREINFYLLHDDQEFDGYEYMISDLIIDVDKYNTWDKLCKYLEENYREDVLEIETC